MITDPYIGMPITLGGSCTGASKPPQKPSQMPPQMPSQKPPQMPSQKPPQNGGANGGGDSRAFDSMYLGSLPIAMTYTPMQQWKNIYEPAKGLRRGTIFAELDLPFKGRTVHTENKKGGHR